jgi:hypothetical protein
MGKLLVGQSRTRLVYIKNNTKYATSFEVDRSTIPENCQVSPEEGRLSSDGLKEITIQFGSRIAGDFYSKIRFNIRGCSSILLPFFAKVILPSI